MGSNSSRGYGRDGVNVRPTTDWRIERLCSGRDSTDNFKQCGVGPWGSRGIEGSKGPTAVGIPTEGWRSPVGEPLEFYASLVALCCISSIGFAIWFTLLKRPFVRVVTLNFWKFLIPLLGSVFAWIVMPGERPTVVALLGMLLIVGALMLLSRDARQSQ